MAQMLHILWLKKLWRKTDAWPIAWLNPGLALMAEALKSDLQEF